MIKVLALFLVLAVGGYGLLWGVVYYRTIAFLDTAAIQVQHHGQLTYGAVSPDIVGGGIGVADVRFWPRGTGDPIHIERTSVVGPNALFFIDLARGFDLRQGRLPPLMGLRLDGLHLRLPSAGPGPSPTGANDGCRVGVAPDRRLLAAMGIEEFVVHARLGWRHDRDSGNATAGVDIEIAGVQTFDIDIGLADVPADGFAGGIDRLPKLAGLGVGVEVDAGFGEAYNRKCAERAELSADEFVARQVGQMEALLGAAGIEPGYGIRYAIDAFYRERSALRLQARPDQPVGILSLMALPPPRLADALDLQLSVNGAPVSDFEFRWLGPDNAGIARIDDIDALLAPLQAVVAAEPTPPPTADPSGEAVPPSAQPESEIMATLPPTAAPPVTPGADAAPSQPAPGSEPGHAVAQPSVGTPRYRVVYRRVGKRQLGRLLRRPVRITSRGQSVREGLLVAYDGDSASIQQRVHGGRFTAHLSVADIRKVEVKIRERVDDPRQTAVQ